MFIIWCKYLSSPESISTFINNYKENDLTLAYVLTFSYLLEIKKIVYSYKSGKSTKNNKFFGCAHM